MVIYRKVHILRITHFSETTKDRNPLPDVGMRTYLWKRIIQGTFGQNLVKIDKMVSEI
jgi:hypothetical protein